MRRRARQLANSAADADDLVAETFAIACVKAAGLSDIREQQIAWLFATLKHVAANHRRTHARRSAIAGRLRWNVAVAPDPSSRLTAVQALYMLNERDRHVLIQTAGAAPEHAGQPPRTPADRMRLSRARRRLLEHFVSSESG